MARKEVRKKQNEHFTYKVHNLKSTTREIKMSRMSLDSRLRVAATGTTSIMTRVLSVTTRHCSRSVG